MNSPTTVTVLNKFKVNGSAVTHKFFFEADLRSVQPNDIKAVQSDFKFSNINKNYFNGFGTWFDVTFEGSQSTVLLTTSPFNTLTHWKQDMFLFDEPIKVKEDQILEGKILAKQGEWIRHYNVDISFSLDKANKIEKDDNLEIVDNECPKFHQHHSLQFCAISAINNLFQEQRFDKKRFDDIAYKLSLISSPNSWFNPHKSFLGTGNYDANVLIFALKEENLEVQWFDSRKDVEKINFDNIVGIIANTCYRRISWLPNFFISRHWLLLKQFGEKFYNVDSVLHYPKAFEDKNEFLQFLRDICNDKEAELLLVVKPENLNQAIFD